jgi:hypothetical protein
MQTMVCLLWLWSDSPAGAATGVYIAKTNGHFRLGGDCASFKMVL